MCGIIGYLGYSDSIKTIINGLTILQNRGYDSVGISYIDQSDELKTIKYASDNTNDSLETLIQNTKDITSHIGIGHTRWATHGGKTHYNAHPHQDNKQRISLVHNGIIENYYELKTKLIENGYFFNSQTDTEVISVLIGYYLDNGHSVEKSIQKTVDTLTGTWALLIIHRDYPKKMWITRKGSPLLLGFDDECIMVVSEQIAFGFNINQYVVLDNDDLIEINNVNNQFLYNKDMNRYPIKEKSKEVIELYPTGYSHWMLKEIYEQPQCIMRAINNGGRIKNNKSVKLGGLDANYKTLLKLNHIILLGCGTSLHSGLWSLDIFKSLTIFDTVSICNGADFNVKDIPRKGKTGLILISQSGETKDLHRCIQIANDYNLFTIGVVNVADSLIARETNCGVYLNAGREVAVASTKSFTNQCIILSMIAVWFSQHSGKNSEKRKQIISDLRNISIQLNTALLSMEKTIQNILPLINNNKSMFILGKGFGYSIALEGALKIKEVAYIHAEGYSTSELKHGPIALIDTNTPVIIIDIDNEHRDKTNNAYNEIVSRNACIIMITNDEQSVCKLKHPNNTILIANNKTYGGVLAIAIIQLISYYLAVEFEYNPDFPRNLAKVVTVE
jgi:glucosamine--fructose-6-phosphate aminotransferase (isomerizing)